MMVNQAEKVQRRQAAKRATMATIVVATLLALAVSTFLAVYAGIYNVAADAPHRESVYWILKTVRERSVAARASSIVVPSDLTEKRRIESGAAQYSDMCSSCHLGPGLKRTEISQGLYPRAPELRRGSALTPAEQFWIVKHGIKMTGMPAWGVTHGDELLWDIVAFLGKLPQLSPSEYDVIVKSAPKTHEQMMEDPNMTTHDHGQH